MAQAGIHAMVGVAFKKVASRQEWLLLGVILGNLLPDLDNYAVAIATIAQRDPHGLHRTFTHSLFTILVVISLFLIISRIRREPRWANLGLGLGLGVGMHILLDLLIWFNGVELLWPLGGWVNLWEGIQPPDWFQTLLNPAELLFFGLFLAWLAQAAKKHHTNTDFLSKLRWWILAMVILLVVFTPLAYIMTTGYLTVFGAVYLFVITAVIAITVRMRQTIAAVG